MWYVISESEVIFQGNILNCIFVQALVPNSIIISIEGDLYETA